MHKVVKRCRSCGAEYNIKMLMQARSWSSMDQYNTRITGSVLMSCGDSQEAEDPEEQSWSQMTDDDTWFPLVNGTQVGAEEHIEGGGVIGDDGGAGGGAGGGGAVLTCGRSDQEHCAIINFLHRDFWTATCELVVNTDKQERLKVRSLRDHFFPLHTYVSDCVCVCVVVLVRRLF